MLFIKPLERIKFRSLIFLRDACRSIQVQNRTALRAKQCTLIGRRQIAVRPDGSAVDGGSARILDHHVARHVLVGRTQTVVHPGTDRRTAGELIAGRDVKRRRTVVLIVCFDAVDEGHVVHVLSEIRK